MLNRAPSSAASSQVADDLEAHRLWLRDPSKGRRADFSGRDLRNISFLNCDLTGAIFQNTRLQGAIFEAVALRTADFTSALLQAAQFTDCILDQATFEQAALNNATLFKSGGDSVWLHGVDATDCRIVRSDFANVSLPATMRGGTLVGSTFSGARGSEAPLFHHTTIVDCRLKGVTLPKADFDHATLRRVDFAGAVLTGATFNHAILDHVDFTGADLRAASFDSAVIEAVEVEDADDTHATFENVRILPGCSSAHVDLGVRLASAGGRPPLRLVAHG